MSKREVAKDNIRRPRSAFTLIFHLYPVKHRAASVDERLSVAADEPRRPPFRRNRPGNASVADANNRQARLNRPRHGLPGMLLRFDRVREPAVVGDEDEHLRTLLGQGTNLRRISIFEANAAAKKNCSVVRLRC